MDNLFATAFNPSREHRFGAAFATRNDYAAENANAQEMVYTIFTEKSPESMT